MSSTMNKEDVSSEARSDGTLHKVCRACTDFKTWMEHKSATKPKTQKTVPPDSKNLENKTVSADSVVVSPGLGQNEERSDCPLDRDSLGRNTWSFLHTVAAYYPDQPTESEQKDMTQFVSLFAKFYPCDVCADDLRDKLKKFPPLTANQEAFSQWLCVIHNQVNSRLGKKEFDCKLVNQRWRDGWEDGSC